MMPGEGVTVQVIRQAPGDVVSGDRPVHVSKLAPHHSIDDVLIEWAESATVTDRRSTTTSDATLYCPAGSDVLGSDHIRLPDMDLYRVVGKPEAWHYGEWEPGLVVTVKAVK